MPSSANKDLNSDTAIWAHLTSSRSCQSCLLCLGNKTGWAVTGGRLAGTRLRRALCSSFLSFCRLPRGSVQNNQKAGRNCELGMGGASAKPWPSENRLELDITD